MPQPTRKNQYGPIPPIDPTKRAKSIRDAVKFGRIKQSAIINETLVLLDQIVVQEIKTA